MALPAIRGRLINGLALGGGIIAAALWMPSWMLLLVLLAFTAVGIVEFYEMMDAKGMPNFKVVGTLGGLLLILSTWFNLTIARIHHPGEWEVIILFLVTVVILLRLFPQKNNPRPIETLGTTLLGILYVPFLFNFVTKLLLTWDHVDSRWLVIYLFFVVKLNDIGAYFVGSAIGRHKLLPRISPAKTWEGVFGGIGTAVAASILFWWWTGGSIGGVRLMWVDALALGFLLGACGTIGDLTESMFKRAAGVKDSGHLFRGMGGVLDVIDSILFAAPALFIYIRIFVT